MNYPKRVKFPEGQQKAFLELAQKKLNLTNDQLADLCKVHIRSLTDWKREKYLMSYPAFKKLRYRKITTPKNLEMKEPFWYVSNGSLAGWLAVKKKYGGRVPVNEAYRKKRWYEWWNKKGRYRKDLITGATKPLNPPKVSKELAEFVGILLGDGGITKNQITITLHAVDDKEYKNFVVKLITKLFGIKPAIYKSKSSPVNKIAISRTELVKFCCEKLGLKIGNKVKQQVGIPSWIDKSKIRTKYCIRGLFDTDGCFYIDKHRYKEKIYYNAGMNFTNRSLPILNFFKTKLEKLGFHPTQKTYSVPLRKEGEIRKYFKEIGSSNYKHINKFSRYYKSRYGGVPEHGQTGWFRKPLG